MIAKERVKFPVRVGLLGCGTVGGGVLRLLEENREYLASRVGAPLEVTRVLVRDDEKDRVPECRREWLTTRADDVLSADLDVLIEVMGGEEPARSLVARALDAGKSVVTANKLLVARHGTELVARAVANGADLAFEASVGGGIPILRTLREAFTSDWVVSVHGILNGTCNYILTRMRDEGLAFDDALAEAQRLGYAEAEPSLDVDGHDAAQKLVVTSMLAFGASVDVASVPVEGIRSIDRLDFEFAARFGYTIKHLAIGRDLGDRIVLRVHPALVPKTSVLANIDGVLNGVKVVGRALGPCLLVGRGAGDMPTAVSVVADVVDVARSKIGGEPGLATRGIQVKERPLVPLAEVHARYYLRFDVEDRPGVVGAIATELGRAGVSIEQMVQDGRAKDSDSAVPVLLVTHETDERALRGALVAIGAQGFLRGQARLLRIEAV
ncbi:MAG: homoserine dehydrogenase [Polyangiaceae bacterium]|nr:homoserine dehydrogenase [Polyangiaceae bacterium]